MSSSRLHSALVTFALVAAAGISSPAFAAIPIAQAPLYLQTSIPPLNMLVVGKDHKLYYEAYNDASDLNGDGNLDVGYKPDTIDYYGYFNSRVCYNYGSGRFTPAVAAGGSNGKKCGSRWSGDFLNYITTGRGDALKKVLYGGDRSTDTAALTVLQTNYVTHDAHSWGKEYLSIARDGYNIAEYAPLSVPAANRYHLFAVTSLTNPNGTADGGAPVLRILEDSPYRIWEWVSIEGPVADTRCLHGGNGPDCIGGTTPNHPGHPITYADFTTRLETPFAIAANKYGADVTRNTINCNSADCNPNGSDDDYMTIATGRFRIANTVAAAGTYQFTVNGDDAFDLVITTDGNVPLAGGTAGCWGAGGFRTCGTQTATVALARNTWYRYKFRHEEADGGDGYQMQWAKTIGSNTFGPIVFDASAANVNILTNTAPTFRFYNLRPSLANGSVRQADKFIRVEACPSDAALREANCKQYPDGNFKPTGILHDFGETDRMFFGLLTGSQKSNLEGGILRKNVLSFSNEVNAGNGTFTLGADTILNGADGIVGSFKSMRMIGGSGGAGSNWSWGGGTGDCPSIGTRAIVNGECRMWGNPIGEMMFESLRYFAGGTAHTGFTGAPTGHANGSAEETTMGLTTPAWRNPYATVANGGLGYQACAKPVMTVISDINPSYDSNLPGNPWNGVTISSPAAISSFNANTAGSAIWANEFGGNRDVYIGQSGTAASDAAPSAKTANSFGNIRGLSPEEPTKEGTYYSAAVAYYGWTNPQVNALADEKLRTYAVAVASPLPKIEFPIGSGQLTLLPFAKTVSGTFGEDATRKPTNTIVDFYVQKIVNLPGHATDTTINGGRGYAVFRINYEDVEQGNDHDMDAIVRYEVVANVGGTVTVNLTSEYAAGSANHALGYTVTGSSKDGIYMEVCDLRDGVANGGTTASCAHQTNYIFNTPPGRDPGYCNVGTPPADCAGLPPTATRTFTAGTNTAAITLRDPLWYAAKYGGFDDANLNGVPDGTAGAEWDEDANGVPDKYFLVTNALTLKSELERAFSEIEADAQPSGGVAASGTRRDAGFLAYVPEYDPNDWTGDLKAFTLTAAGTTGPQVWSSDEELPEPDERDIFMSKLNNSGEFELLPFTTSNLGGTDALAAAALGFSATEIATNYPGATIDEVVDFLRGDGSNESLQGGEFRDRARKIGDILNSQPAVLDRGSRGFTSLPESMGGGLTGSGSYGEFVLTTKRTRTPVVFVGSNDGMLHGFDGSAGTDGGKELFAIIPDSVIDQLHLLVNPSYSHRYFVDASPELGDAYLGGEWKTVLLAGNGAGGRSVMAVDVTDPATSFSASNFLWEFADSDLGLTFGRPKVVLLEDDNWYAAFGNGLNSDSHDAYLYLVQLDDVSNVVKIRAAEGDDNDATGLGHNGLGGVTAVDVDFNDRADVIYAPDYQGNIWKFDLKTSSSAGWEVANSGQPLFTAVSGAGDPQQITGAIDVTQHHLAGFMVYFGTGRYLTNDDAAVPPTPPVETFYAIWDNGVSTVSGRSELEEQTILTQEVVTGLGEIRTTSENPIDWTSQRGWFMDLAVTGVGGTGERFLGEPAVQSGRVIFTTFQPLGTQCDPGGRNWLFALSAISGANDISLQPTCNNCGAISLTPEGGSSPPAISPPLITDPQVPANPSGGPDCDPADPDCEPPCVPGVDPGCALPSDGAAINGRTCVNDLSVLLADGVKKFSEVSCGRQSWRQTQ